MKLLENIFGPELPHLILGEYPEFKYDPGLPRYSVTGEDYNPLTRLLPQQENIRHRIHEIVTGGDDYAIVI